MCGKHTLVALGRTYSRKSRFIAQNVQLDVIFSEYHLLRPSDFM